MIERAVTEKIEEITARISMAGSSILPVLQEVMSRGFTTPDDMQTLRETLMKNMDSMFDSDEQSLILQLYEKREQQTVAEMQEQGTYVIPLPDVAQTE